MNMASIWLYKLKLLWGYPFTQTIFHLNGWGSWGSCWKQSIVDVWCCHVASISWGLGTRSSSLGQEKFKTQHRWMACLHKKMLRYPDIWCCFEGRDNQVHITYINYIKPRKIKTCILLLIGLHQRNRPHRTCPDFPPDQWMQRDKVCYQEYKQASATWISRRFTALYLNHESE